MRKTFDLLFPLLFVVLVVAGGLTLLKLDTGNWWPGQASLLYWDAGWYHSIVEHGYRFDAHAANNTAFFPLFPYLWKALGLSPAATAARNALAASACLKLARRKVMRVPAPAVPQPHREA